MQNVAVNHNAHHSAAASRVLSSVFGFIGARFFSGLFYASYYYFRNAFAARRMRQCPC